MPERKRTIHDRSRKNSYKIKVDNVAEDVRIFINDEDGRVYFDKTISIHKLKGINSLHFKFLDNKVCWDGPSSLVVED